MHLTCRSTNGPTWRAACSDRAFRPSLHAGLVAPAEQRITLHEAEADLLFEVASERALSACDPAYLAPATALRAPLLTFDHRLADAAPRALGRQD